MTYAGSYLYWTYGLFCPSSILVLGSIFVIIWWPDSLIPELCYCLHQSLQGLDFTWAIFRTCILSVMDWDKFQTTSSYKWILSVMDLFFLIFFLRWMYLCRAVAWTGKCLLNDIVVDLSIGWAAWAHMSWNSKKWSDCTWQEFISSMRSVLISLLSCPFCFTSISMKHTILNQLRDWFRSRTENLLVECCPSYLTLSMMPVNIWNFHNIFELPQNFFFCRVQMLDITFFNIIL